MTWPKQGNARRLPVLLLRADGPDGLGILAAGGDEDKGGLNG